MGRRYPLLESSAYDYVHTVHSELRSSHIQTQRRHCSAGIERVGPFSSGCICNREQTGSPVRPARSDEHNFTGS